MPLLSRRQHRRMGRVLILCCFVSITAHSLITLDESSDSDSDTTASSSATEVSTVCPPARKRKREAQNLEPKVNAKSKGIVRSGHTSTGSDLPARKRVKRDAETVMGARSRSTAGSISSRSRSRRLASARRLKRMAHEELDNEVAESLEAVSEAFKQWEGWDRFDEWFPEVMKALLECIDFLRFCLARQEGGHEIEERLRTVLDPLELESPLKLCDNTREGGGKIEEWVEAVAKSQVLRSRRWEPRKLLTLG